MNEGELQLMKDIERLSGVLEGLTFGLECCKRNVRSSDAATEIEDLLRDHWRALGVKKGTS